MLVKQLTAKIGAETKEFDQAMKGTSTSLDKCRKKLNKVGKVMAVAGAAIAGAMIVIIKKTAAAGDEIHKMALRTGFSTEALSELKYAAEISGATLGSVEKGVKKMSKTIMDAADGLATYVRAFDRIGLSAKDLIKLSPEQQFDKIARAIASVESPTIRAATAQEIFGRAGTELLPLFAAGAEGLDELRQKAHELGIVFDQEAADKAAALTDAMTTLKGAFTGIGQTIALEFMPYLTGMANAFADSMIDIRKSSKGVVKSIVGFFKILVRTIEGVILAFNSLKVVVFGIGEEIARYLAKVTMGVIIITGYTKKMGIMKGMHEKAKTALKDLVTIGMSYHKEVDGTMESMTDTIILFDKLLAGLEGAEEGYKKTRREIKKFSDGTKEAKDKVREVSEVIINTAIPAIRKLPKEVRNMLPAFEEVEEGIEETTEEIIIQFKSMTEHIIDFTRDLASGFADIFTDMLGIVESITYQMKEFDNSYWENSMQNAQKSYEDRKSLLEKQLEDAAVYYEDLEGKTTSNYEKKKKWIELNVTDEGKKQEMLLALEQKHQTDLEKFRADQLQKESDLQDKLVALEENHQTESARIRAEEDTAREQHAIDEEARQNTLWNKVKTVFGQAVESMLQNWMTDFIGKILLSITDVATSLISDLGSAFKTVKTAATDTGTKVGSALGGIGKTIAGIGKGLGKLITSLASAIAKAATTLAAAAPALLIVLGIALAAYAGFKLISSLFKKKPKTGTMEAILGDIAYVFLHAICLKLDGLNDYVVNFFPKIDYMNSILAKIENILRGVRTYAKSIAKKLGELSGFQTGGYVPKTQLAVVHAGETITPPTGRAGGGVPGGQGAPNVHIDINITAMDSMGVNEFMRNRGIPAIVDAIKINHKQIKTNMRKALEG